jgi:hypothetical protein
MVCGRGLRGTGHLDCFGQTALTDPLKCETTRAITVCVARKRIGAPAHLGIELQIFLQSSCNHTSAKMIESTSFDFQGQRYNLRDLFPHGFTIAFNTNPTPINNSFPLIFCLGFTSFAIGSDAGQTD